MRIRITDGSAMAVANGGVMRESNMQVSIPTTTASPP